MTPAVMVMLAELIRWARTAWHLGLIGRPAHVDEHALAAAERYLRGHATTEPVADVGQLVVTARPIGDDWLTISQGSRYGVPARTLRHWATKGPDRGGVRARRVGTGPRAPHLIERDSLERKLAEEGSTR